MIMTKKEPKKEKKPTKIKQRKAKENIRKKET